MLVMVISPAAVCEVMVMAAPVDIAEAIVTVRPASKVIVPKPELIGELIVTSNAAPVEVMDTVPLLPALIAPLTVTEPNEAVKATLPKALVVMPPAPTVKLPVAAVNVTLALFRVIFVKVIAVVVVAIV